MGEHCSIVSSNHTILEVEHLITGKIYIQRITYRGGQDAKDRPYGSSHPCNDSLFTLKSIVLPLPLICSLEVLNIVSRYMSE